MGSLAFDRLARIAASSGFVTVALGAAVAATSACRPAPTRAIPPPSGTVVASLDTHVASMARAQDGSYWFASRENGLFRYDGTRIVRYTVEDGLASNHVGGVQQDRAGNLVVVSGSNVFSRFDGTRFVTIPVKQGRDATWRLDATDLWFPGGTNVAGVYRFDGVAMHLLMFPTTRGGDEHYAEVPRDKFPNAKYTPYDVFTMMKDSRGHLWFGTALLGVLRYDGGTLAWGPASKHSFGMRAIVEDKDGRFWFTTTDQRYRVSLETGPGQPGAVPAPVGSPAVATLNITGEAGLGDADPIGAFVAAHRDKRGDLWFATLGDGVYRYDGTTTTHYPVVGDDGKPIWVYSMYKDSNDVPWVCTQGAGVHRFNGKAFEMFSP